MSELTVKLGRFRLFLWSNWPELFRRDQYNWIDFNFILLHVEVAEYKESIEFNIALLGINVSVDWFYGERKTK